MLLFQASKTANAETKIPKEFVELIQSVRSQAVLIGAQRMPALAGAWYSKLLEIAGGGDNYLSLLSQMISSKVFSKEDKFVAGFFYGYRLAGSDFLERVKQPDGTINKDAVLQFMAQHFDSGTIGKDSIPPAQGVLLALTLSLNAAVERDVQSKSEALIHSPDEQTKKTIGKPFADASVKVGSPKSYLDIDFPTAVPYRFEQPPPIFVSRLLAGSSVFQDIINRSFGAIGGSLNQDEGTWFTPSYASGDLLASKYYPVLKEFETKWLTAPSYDGATTTVQDILKRDLRDQNELGKFTAALISGHFGEAWSYLRGSRPGEAKSDTYKALGNLNYASGTVSSVLGQHAFAAMANHALSTGANLIVELDEAGSTAIEFRYRYDGTWLITNKWDEETKQVGTSTDYVGTHTFGSRFLAKIDSLDTTLLLGGGGAFSSKNDPTWFIQAAGQSDIPITKYVSAIITGSVNAVLGSQHEPLYSGEIGGGVKLNAKRLDTDVSLSYVLFPPSDTDEAFWKLKGRIGYKMNADLRLDLEGGTYMSSKTFFKNASGVTPWYAKIGVTITL